MADRNDQVIDHLAHLVFLMNRQGETLIEIYNQLANLNSNVEDLAAALLDRDHEAEPQS